MPPALSIGAFSQRCGISVSALRFYDQCGVLKPASVDPASGYRSYAEHQVVEAEQLRDLRRLDLSIDQIQRFASASTGERDQLITDQLAQLDGRLQQAAAVARSLRQRLHQEENPMPTTQLDARALAQAIDQVLPAVGKDPKRPALHAVLVEARDGSLRLVATDAHRLVVRDLLPHPPATGAFRVLVDVEAVRRLRTALPHDGTVALEEDGPALTVTTSRSQERLPLLDASFPDYERFLAADPDARRLTALRSAVLAALEPIADKDHVPLAFSQGELRFDGGANADGVSVPAAFQGDDLELAIRPSYMRDAVLHSVGPDVVIEVTDPEQPVVFRSADDGSYTCMVMPVKVASPRRRR